MFQIMMIMINITTGFSVFHFIPASVNAYSREIGQSTVYTVNSTLYYNVQIFSIIRSGSSDLLCIDDTDRVSIQTTGDTK